MIQLWLIVMALSIGLQQGIPYRQESTYKIKLDYDFKNKTLDDKDVVRISGRLQKEKQGLLPYLIVNFTFLEIGPDDYRIKVIDNSKAVAFSKKIKPDQVYKIDMGFTDDMKDGITPNQYNIHIMDRHKVVQSRVVLQVLEDGTFLINEKVHGRL